MSKPGGPYIPQGLVRAVNEIDSMNAFGRRQQAETAAVIEALRSVQQVRAAEVAAVEARKERRERWRTRLAVCSLLVALGIGGAGLALNIASRDAPQQTSVPAAPGLAPPP